MALSIWVWVIVLLFTVPLATTALTTKDYGPAGDELSCFRPSIYRGYFSQREWKLYREGTPVYCADQEGVPPLLSEDAVYEISSHSD